GPDVTGGPLMGGHAYNIPAAVAWASLPLDNNYATSWGGHLRQFDESVFQSDGSGTPPPPPPSSSCDVNNDGNVNVADVQIEVNMALGIGSCTNPSGQCTVTQVQRVVNAALGGSCVSL